MLAEALIAAAVPVAIETGKNVIKGMKDGAMSAHTYMKDASLIDVGKASRVEPLTIVGGDCLHLAYLPDILQSTASMFAAYYLQALAFTATVGHVKATNVLERLNPNRNFTNASLIGFEAYKESLKEERSDWRLAEESYAFRLPTTHNKRAIALEEDRVEFALNSTTRVIRDDKTSYRISKEDFHVGLEADNGFSGARGTGDKHFEKVFGKNEDYLSTADKKKAEKEKLLDEEYEKKLSHGHQLDKEKDQDAEEKALNAAAADIQADADRNKTEAAEKAAADKEAANRRNNRSTISVSKDAMSQAREMFDLSVGKMVSVQIGGGFDEHGNKLPIIDMNISFRLMVNTVPESTLQGLLCKGAMDNSMTERYHAWRAGRISFVKDLIFCQDLIDETKKSIMDDKTGVHMEVVSRVNNAKKFGLLSKNPSMNVASNLYVISEVTAGNIERQLGGKLSSPTVREKIFKQGYAMIICVIDRQYERITFYHRGINASTNVSLKDIQISNRKSGPDIGDLLKMYTLGSAPHL